VDQAVRHWAGTIVATRPEVRRIGYFGSYSRGDWGVGSDLDLIIVVERADQPFERRSAEWDVTDLPVPADILIYTQDEFESIGRRGDVSFPLMRETTWVYVRP
jgi:predicted nucleotidyltransferase